MTPEKKVRWADVVMILVIIAAMGGAVIGMSNDGKTLPVEAQMAPAFNLKTLGGKVSGPGLFNGRVVLLDFWATWCGPCRKQMPALAAIEADASLHDKVAILSINTDDPEPGREALVQRFMEANRLNFDVLLDTGAVAGQYGVRRIPSIVVIRPDGSISYARSGVVSESKLRRLIAEAGAP